MYNAFILSSELSVTMGACELSEYNKRSFADSSPLLLAQIVDQVLVHLKMEDAQILIAMLSENLVSLTELREIWLISRPKLTHLGPLFRDEVEEVVLAVALDDDLVVARHRGRRGELLPEELGGLLEVDNVL